MSVEEVHTSLRRKAEAMFGAEEASVLLDRPPGGWQQLVTIDVLNLKFDAFRTEMHREMTDLRSELRVDMAELSASVDRRLRAQTWMMMSTMIASVGVSATLAATLSHL